MTNRIENCLIKFIASGKLYCWRSHRVKRVNDVDDWRTQTAGRGVRRLRIFQLSMLCNVFSTLFQQLYAGRFCYGQSGSTVVNQLGICRVDDCIDFFVDQVSTVDLNVDTTRRDPRTAIIGLRSHLMPTSAHKSVRAGWKEGGLLGNIVVSSVSDAKIRSQPVIISTLRILIDRRRFLLILNSRKKLQTITPILICLFLLDVILCHCSTIVQWLKFNRERGCCWFVKIYKANSL